MPAYTVEYYEVAGETATVSIPTTVSKLIDAPYCMFAMPYGEVSITVNGAIVSTNGSLNLDIATELTRKYSSGDGKLLYDLQLLPYCPLPNTVQDDGSITLTGEEYYLITGELGNVGVLMIPSASTFALQIEQTIELDNVKVENQTELYRVVSPNYSGQFDLNIAKNEGLTGFNVYCTYKPFQPFIQVMPNFSGLYGSNWQDARGLICGGDFSLPMLSSAWESYQLSNKNYQRIFDRQIENMEVNNRLTNISKGIEASLGAVQTGVVAGMSGGGVIGGIAAGVTSAAGGAADMAILRAQQREAIDYSKDLFGYTLGNIQALPNSLSKVSAFVANNKIFPFLEHYTCTDEEKKAFANKIAWNGMTVMRIGTLNEFLSNSWSYTAADGAVITDKGYIKAKLIRAEHKDYLTSDFHEINELAHELFLGVYTK